LLGLLVLSWLLGLAGVWNSGLPDVKPGESGHFIVGSFLLLGFTLSTWLIMRHRIHAWARRLHVAANGLLIVVLFYQALLGINRLYKFNLLGPVPQAHGVRKLLAIKFGLVSPPVTARAGQQYTGTMASAGPAFGGTWRSEPGAVLFEGDRYSQSQLWGFLTTEKHSPLLVFGDRVFGNGEFSVEFQMEPNSTNAYAGLAFRLVDEHNYYMVSAAADQRVTLARWNNGARQVLLAAPATVRYGQWHGMRVVTAGDAISLYLDGRLAGVIHDEGWKTGMWGLGAKGKRTVRFRDVHAIGR
jgi:hypothetical protein